WVPSRLLPVPVSALLTPSTTHLYTLSLHDALPIFPLCIRGNLIGKISKFLPFQDRKGSRLNIAKRGVSPNAIVSEELKHFASLFHVLPIFRIVLIYLIFSR